MDREIIYIHNILSESEIPLSTSEISKKIYAQFEIRVSKKIVQNYLWSYFREEIEYDTENYVYSFKNEKIDTNKIDVSYVTNSPRAVSMKVEGTNIYIEYNREIEDLLKAVAMLNLKGYNSNYDLIKNINRYIDNL